MNVPTITLARGRHRRAAVSLVLLGALTVALPSATLGQDGADPSLPFPQTLGGLTLEVETFSGPEYVAQFSSGAAEDLAFIEGTEALVDGVGKTLEDLTVKSALVEPSPGNLAAVVAFQIDGSDARDFTTDAIDLLLGDVVTPELLVRPVAGKWVLRVADAAMPGVYPRTVFIDGDTAWIIQGDEPIVWEALDQLPAATPASAADEGQLVAQLPLLLDGRRRTGLYEATEPLFMPTLSERLGPELETWLLDLYLKAGVTPADMVGLIAWWGVESSQDSVQIEGYRLPGADADRAASLLTDVILAEGSALPEGVVRSEAQIGGRDVVTLDSGAFKQHIFRSADTVWVVTDNADEPELVAEAISALP